MLLGWLWAAVVYVLGHPLVVRCVHLWLWVLLSVAACVRWATSLLGRLRRWSHLTPLERRLVERMRTTTSYAEWHACALQLDSIQGHEEWKKEEFFDTGSRSTSTTTTTTAASSFLSTAATTTTATTTTVPNAPTAGSAAASTPTTTTTNALYNHQLIKTRLELLRGLSHLAHLPDKSTELLDSLRSGLLRNLGGIGNEELYSYCHTGTKHLVEDYIDEVCLQLRRVAERDCLSVQERYSFFFETRQSYGSSALLLSGGASLGLYHLGVIKALHERGLLPKVVSGASAGALVAALVCVLRDEELPTLFRHPECMRLDTFGRRGRRGEVSRKLWRLLTEGVLMDIRLLEEVCRSNVGDITFREAFLRTGRILNITVSGSGNYELPRLLNYLTAPSVLLWSAACASCALPGLYRPVQLMCKDGDGRIRLYEPACVLWTDGTLECDLPMARLSELFNINHFIVSQVGPHVAPFLSSKHRRRAPDHPAFARHSLLSALATAPLRLARRSARLLSSLLRSEARHRLLQLARILGSPTFSSLVQQNYLGHVNIVAELSLADFLSLLRNPTPQSLRHSILTSQRWAWPKLSIIGNHMKIEQTLEHCLVQVRLALQTLHSQSTTQQQPPAGSATTTTTIATTATSTATPPAPSTHGTAPAPAPAVANHDTSPPFAVYSTPTATTAASAASTTASTTTTAALSSSAAAAAAAVAAAAIAAAAALVATPPLTSELATQLEVEHLQQKQQQSLAHHAHGLRSQHSEEQGEELEEQEDEEDEEEPSELTDTEAVGTVGDMAAARQLEGEDSGSVLETSGSYQEGEPSFLLCDDGKL
jgi:predicted acylesterase/phospholipase RssA